MKAPTAVLSWLLEGILAAVVAIGIAASGIATNTTELARILFSVSLAGLLVWLLAEGVGRRRWMVR